MNIKWRYFILTTGWERLPFIQYDIANYRIAHGNLFAHRRNIVVSDVTFWEVYIENRFIKYNISSVKIIVIIKKPESICKYNTRILVLKDDVFNCR